MSVIAGLDKFLKNMNEEIDKKLEEKSKNDDLRKLLEKNLEISEDMHKMIKKIGKYIFWQQVFNILKLLIIVVPIILGIIYLPPLLGDLISQYGEFFKNPMDAGNLEMLEMLKKQKE